MVMNFLEAMVEKTQYEVEILAIYTSSDEVSITEAYNFHFNSDKVRWESATSQRNYMLVLSVML